MMEGQRKLNGAYKRCYMPLAVLLEKTIQSFVLTALTALRAFTNQNMVQLTDESSFDLESIRDQKTIVYFIIPAQHAAATSTPMAGGVNMPGPGRNTISTPMNPTPIAAHRRQPTRSPKTGPDRAATSSG